MEEPEREYPLMIIGDRPTKDDISKESIMDHRLLNIMIDQVVRIPNGLVYKTFATKCASAEKDIKLVDTCTCIDTYLKLEVLKTKPKAILVMGEQAMNAVLGLSGITKQRGQVLEVDYDGHLVKVIPTFSLGYLERVEVHMKTFAEDLQKAYHLAIGYEVKAGKTNVTICDTVEKVVQLMDYVEQTGKSSFDWESTGLDYWSKDFFLTCLSISFQHGSSYVIPMKHREPVFEGKKVIELQAPIFTDDEYAQIVEILKVRFFGNPFIQKVAHNLKYDLHCCRTIGIDVFRGRFDDTMLMHHVINGRLRHGLKEISDNYYREFSGYEDETKKYAWGAMPAKILFPYSGNDTDLTLRLSTLLEDYLMKDERSYVLYRNLSMPFCFAAEKAEYKGMLIDRDFTLNAIKEVDAIIEEKIKHLKEFKAVKRFEEHKREESISARLSELNNKLIDASSKAAETQQALNEKKRESAQNKLEALNEKYAEAQAVANTLNQEMLTAKFECEEKGEVYVSSVKVDKKIQNALDKANDWQRKINEVKAIISVLEVPVNDAVDSKTIAKIKEEIQLLKTGEKQLYEGINFSSSTQIGELIYGEHGFRIKKLIDRRSKKEIESTGREVLEELKDDSGFLKELLILRSLEKMSGTYIKGIWDRVDDNCYVHTSLKQIGTYTGRLSSADPNLQNLPNIGKLKDELSKTVVGKVKRMFSVPEGHTLIAVDFSQAELRIVAEYADETNMLSAYGNNIDLHKKTGCKVAGITLQQFDEMDKDKSKKIRNDAKPVNFGYVYGQSAEGFVDFAKGSYGITFSLQEATHMRNAYFEEYPNLLKYHETYKAKGKKFGCVRTFFGRRIFLDDIYSNDNFLRGAAERQAINSPIQGTAGEWTLFCIAMLQYRLSSTVHFVNTVHDSILFYCPDHLVDKSVRMIKDTCENPPIMHYFGKQLEKVKMQLDCEVSTKNWKELEGYKF